jgi:hypothetical protein
MRSAKRGLRSLRILNSGKKSRLCWNTAYSYLALGDLPSMERMLNEAEKQLRPTDTNTRADISLVWALLEAACGNRDAAAHWFDRAIGEYEQLLLRTTTPFYGWNVDGALEQAAKALPATARVRRERILSLWTEQDRRFPGEPYIEEKIAEG